MSNNRYEKVELDQFDQMVTEHNSWLVDVYQPASEIEYRGAHRLVATEETGLGKVAIHSDLTINGYRQLCNRAGAPHQWLLSDKCPSDLEQTILSRLLQYKEDRLLLRFQKNTLDEFHTCRAVLSDKYLIYNHADFWGQIKEAIIGTDMMSLNPVIWKPWVSDAMDAWLLFDNVNADPTTGTPPDLYDKGGYGGLRPAIHFRNTEDGTGRVRIDSGLFRSYCTNGVIFGWKSDNAMSAEHLGKSFEHMNVKVAMAIADAASTCKLGIDKFLASTKIWIKEDVVNKVVAEWSKVYSLNASVSDLWAQALSPARTWADIVMGTSDFAGQLADRDMVTTMEEASGSLLFAEVPLRYKERS